MNFNAETFATDLILPRLVEWFNNQPEEDRNVPSGELLLFKVKVVENSSGEPELFIGVTDPTASDSSRNYVGEATFMWVGGRGEAQTATASSFYEISRYTKSVAVGGGGAVDPQQSLSTYLNIGFKEATHPIENSYRLVTRQDQYVDAIPTVSAVAFPGFPAYALGPHGDTYGSSEYYYTENLNDITQVSVGQGFMVTRKRDGTVWAFGPNSRFGKTPTRVSTPRAKPVKKALALYETILVLYEDGTLDVIKSLVPPVEAVDVAHVNSTTWSSIQTTDPIPQDPSQYTQRFTDIKLACSTFVDADAESDNVHEYVILKDTTNRLHVWGVSFNTGNGNYSLSTEFVSINSEADAITNVKDFAGNGLWGIALKYDGTAVMWGQDIGTRYGNIETLNLRAPYTKCVMSGYGIVGLLSEDLNNVVFSYPSSITSSLSMIFLPSFDFTEAELYTTPCLDIQAGFDHIVAKNGQGQLEGNWFGNNKFRKQPFNKLTSQFYSEHGRVVNYFAGSRALYVEMSDGTAHWFTEQASGPGDVEPM